MKYFFWICFLFVILSGLSIHFHHFVFAQDSFSNSTTPPKIDQKENISTKFINDSYSFEPFLELDGKDFKDIPHNDSLSLETFAISAWIKTNLSNIETQAQLVNKGGFNIDEKGKNMNYGIWFSSDGTISGGFETKSGKDFIVTSRERYDDDKWHFVLFSYDGHVLRLDIDGKTKIATTKEPNNVIPDTKGKQPIRIGANSGDESKFFTGDIDEIRIWNRGLTPAEISQIYTNNTFNSDGLVVYINFDKNGLFTRTNMSLSIFDKPKSSGVSTTTAAKKQSSTAKINEKSESFNSSYLFNVETTNSTDFFHLIQSTHDNQSSTIEKNSSFNIAVAADWGCEEDTKKTTKNIKKKDPEIVIAIGDLSYDKSADCWFDIIKPLKSKMKISFGDHEYNDTNHGKKGLISQYLEPLNLTKTYYSFDKNNVHFTVIDSQIDYDYSSDQYRFIEQDLKNASTNPNIDWIFVVDSRPLYTSPSYHPSDSAIRDIFHPLFDQYDVDIVFSSENHNYQRTFPLKYNNNDGDSSNPIITDRNQTIYTGDYQGQIYFIVGIGGKSLYKIKEQASFVAKQDDDHFGFLNIEITGNTLNGTLYANENKLSKSDYVDYKNHIIDQFTISKPDKENNNNVIIS